MSTTLWPHQQQAVEQLAPLGRGMLAMDMGDGKTRTALELVARWGCRRVLILCPLKVVRVWPQEFAKHVGPGWSVSALDSGTIKQRCQRLTTEALCAAVDEQPYAAALNYDALPYAPLPATLSGLQWDCIIADECVPAGTPINTPDGFKPVEQIRVGDEVMGFDHSRGEIVTTKVLHTFKRETADPLVTVNDLSLTGNHPVWTAGRGYVNASDVSNSDTVGYLEHGYTHMQVVRARVPVTPERQQVLLQGVRRSGIERTQVPGCLAGVRVVRQTIRAQRSLREAPLLWQKLFGKVAHVTAGIQSEIDARATRCCIGANEAPKSGPGICGSARRVFELRAKPLQGPGETGGDTGQSSRQTAGQRVRAIQRRQRPRADRSSADARGRAWLAAGVCRLLREKPQSERLAQLLQDRPGRAGFDDRHRGRRAQSLGCGAEAGGRKEGRFSVLARLAHHSLQERGYTQRSASGVGADRGRREVFNFETGTNNYFAGGLLVHNCQRLKDPGGAQSQLVAQIAGRIPHRLLLTGTPMPHSQLDIFAQWRILDPAVFGPDFFRFRHQYAVMEQKTIWVKGKAQPGKPPPKGRQKKIWAIATDPQTKQPLYRNTADLQAKLGPLVFRSSATAKDLPETVDQSLYCLLDQPTQRVYHSLAEDFIAEVDAGTITVTNALTKMIRLAQVCNGFSTDTATGDLISLSTEKQDLLADVMADLPQEEPLVVFGRFVEDLAAIGRAAKQQKREYREVSGARNELEQWQAGDGNVLGVQLQAGGVGVDFTRARYQVYYSLDYNLGNYLQTRKRIHRPGQTRPVTYLHLLAAGTVDEQIMSALQAREEVVTAVVEGLRRRTK